MPMVTLGMAVQPLIAQGVKLRRESNYGLGTGYPVDLVRIIQSTRILCMRIWRTRIPRMRMQGTHTAPSEHRSRPAEV